MLQPSSLITPTPTRKTQRATFNLSGKKVLNIPDLPSLTKSSSGILEIKSLAEYIRNTFTSLTCFTREPAKGLRITEKQEIKPVISLSSEIAKIANELDHLLKDYSGKPLANNIIKNIDNLYEKLDQLPSKIAESLGTSEDKINQITGSGALISALVEMEKASRKLEKFTKRENTENLMIPALNNSMTFFRQIAASVGITTSTSALVFTLTKNVPITCAISIICIVSEISYPLKNHFKVLENIERTKSYRGPRRTKLSDFALDNS